MRNHKRPRKLSCQTSLSWPKTEELFLYFFPNGIAREASYKANNVPVWKVDWSNENGL